MKVYELNCFYGKTRTNELHTSKKNALEAAEELTGTGFTECWLRVWKPRTGGRMVIESNERLW